MTTMLFELPSAKTANDGSNRKVFHDAGVKIGGAKKDRYGRISCIADLETMSDKEAFELVNKHGLLGKLDIEQEKNNDVSAGAVFLKKKILDALCVRPQDRKEDRELYVNFCLKLKEALSEARSREDVEKAAERMCREGVSTSVVGKRLWRALCGAYYGELNTHARKYEDEDYWGWAGKEQVANGEKFTFKRIVAKEVKRIGGIEVDPLSVTEESIISTFGFRAVEYGNWIKDEDAAYHVLNAVKALYDIASVLCMPARMLSWDSNLAIAFGARGSGSASAHYESSRHVINLTKFRGGGSLAHEWGHFLDNMLATRTGGKAYFATEERSGPLSEIMGIIKDNGQSKLTYYHAKRDEYRKIRDESNARIKVEGWNERNRELNSKVWEMHRDIEQMRKSWNRKRFFGCSKFYRDAVALGDYWKRDEELFARAFEAYVEDKLEAMGCKNTYLVDGTKARYAITRKQREGVEPYPQGEERKALFNAFEQFFAGLRSMHCRPQLPMAVNF